MPRKSHQAPEEYEASRMRLATAIGKRVRDRRTEMGLDQEALRAKLELGGGFISRSALSRLERGQALPDAAQIIALVAALGCSFDWLLRGDNSDPDRR